MVNPHLLLLLTIFPTLPTPVLSKGQYVQPLNMGLQMAVPYDIGNIFNRPIAGVSSVVLAVSMLVVLFLGIITSPFGYMLGVPSRKYVMGGKPDRPTLDKRSFSIDDNSDYVDRLFYLMPMDMEPSCRLYTICFAHGTFKHLPVALVKIYGYFSKDMSSVTKEVREAVEIGLEDNAYCEERYKDCSKPIFSILIETLVSWLPQRARRQTRTRRE